MGKINWATGEVSHTIDWSQSPQAIADYIGVDDKTSGKFAALTAAMAGVAHDQATLNKFAAVVAQLTVKAVQSGGPLPSLFTIGA